ncbi:GNAT family N-acetyltransferase [Erwinia phyllosphaerae]|uniref:GNAT family N-acetyltransferase n=1 Tax=Erwinia phyllosphaerae TaxID=2853256 RepID=UPI001FEED4EA|nr:GNAT family N-acetyltransferase [Erwinia phyllosphaerae]MBV4365248.1 GNAT family N-acetyltransferase [Erwinia phyllosphaerae]
MPLQLRKATLADAILLNELGYSLYLAHFRHMWMSESDMNDFLEREYSLSTLEQSLKKPGMSWYVVETDRPIGFAKFTWESTIPDTKISGVLLNKFYIDPTETGKGYGQLIFNKIIDLVRTKRKDFLWLEVLEQNERACNFYNKQGMRYIKDIIFKTASQQSVLKIMGMPLRDV